MPILRGSNGEEDVNIEINEKLYKKLIEHCPNPVNRRDCVSSVFIGMNEKGLDITTENVEKELKDKLGVVMHV